MGARSRLTRRELALGALGAALAGRRGRAAELSARLSLPQPNRNGGPALASALARRRSVRSWRPVALELAEIGQLLWAAQGITHSGGLRTAPSAGALYPLEVRLAAARVAGLPPALYRYDPQPHELERVADGDRVPELARAAHDQRWMAGAAAIVALCGVTARTAARYGARAERYVRIEAGHAGQNVCLQAVALGLGAVVVGAFDDERVGRLLALPEGCAPITLLPVGRP